MAASYFGGFQVLPNRVVALLTALLGLVAAVAPAAANLDWTSTAGVIVGVGVVAAASLKWLTGWQKHESEVAAATREARYIRGGGLDASEDRP